LIDEGRALDILDQMRMSIPEEIKQAQQEIEERDKAIALAQEEAAQIISRAREDAARLLSEHVLRAQAEQQAQRILDEAQRQALVIRQGADDYAAQVLVRLSEEISGLQRTIANGLAALQGRNARPGSPAPPAPPSQPRSNENERAAL